MGMMILGLVLFLGVHSTRIVANGWRADMIARLGAARWKALYAAVSLAGLVLLVWGFSLTRQQPVQFWAPCRVVADIGCVYPAGRGLCAR